MKVNLPEKTLQLKQLEIVSKRKFLDDKDHVQLLNQRTGFQGEHLFSSVIKEKLVTKPLVLYDTKLKVGTNECQIDCLMIFKECVFIFEVKNFKGNYQFDSEWWVQEGGEKIATPMNQLNRAHALVEKMLKRASLNMEVKSVLVFVNPSFVLYKAEWNTRIIFPGQIEHLMKTLNSYKVADSFVTAKVLDVIRANSIERSKYDVPMKVDIATLDKGVTCDNCGGFMEYSRPTYRYSLCCKKCKSVDTTEKALLRMIQDFTVLYPEEKITVKSISNWIDGILSERQIRYIIQKHYIKCGKNKSTYYVKKSESN